MKLNMYVLEQCLSKTYANHTIGTRNVTSDLITRPIMYEPGCHLQENTLYVVQSFELPLLDRLPLGVSIVCTGAPRDPFLKRGIPILWFEDEIGFISLFNEIQIIFNRYDHWDDGLRRLIDANSGINELMDLSKGIFENPLTVISTDYEVIYQSDPQLISEKIPGEEIDERGFAPTYLVSLFAVDSDFAASKSKTEPYILPAKLLPVRTLSSNMWIDGICSGMVAINEFISPFTKSDEFLIAHLSSFIQIAYERFVNTRGHRESGMGAAILGMLADGKNSTREVASQLSSVGWSEADSFICVKLVTGQRDVHNLTFYYACKDFERNFPGSIAVTYEASIFALINLTVPLINRDTVLSDLAIYIRDGYYRAGCSFEFIGLGDLRYYYRQAELAIDFGSRIDPTYWCWKFENYALDYLFSKCLEELPASLVAEPSLLTLKQYDADNGTNLFGTFREYLRCNKNTVGAARNLFISRSTMLYRMRRIKEISSIKADTPLETLYCMLSYYLLES